MKEKKLITKKCESCGFNTREYCEFSYCAHCGKKILKKWADYGESSLTLLSVQCDIDKKDPRIPSDSSDLRRCIHLFECLDFGPTRYMHLLKLTAEKYPIWKPLYKNWNKLLELYNEEKDKERAPKLYKLMKKIGC